MMQNRQSRSNTRGTTESVASYDSTGKMKSFRRLFTRFAEKTSMQGVPYINMAKFWWAKIIWVFLLLAALAAMSLHLWFLFDQYFTWPKNTKVELGFQTLAFPQVTICNTNVLHKTRFNSYNDSEELKMLAKDLEPENFVSEQYDENYNYETTTAVGDQTTPEQGGTGTNANKRRKRYIREYGNINISKYDEEFTNHEDEFLDTDEDYSSTIDSSTQISDLFTQLYMDIDKYDREYLGHQISDMLVECTFNGRECTSDQFELHQTSEYGNCWTLTDRKLRVKKAGPRTGLTLILFLETDEYLKGITTGYGMRISLQKPNTYPFPADKGVFIPASMETDIGLKLVNITRLGGNYGDCDNGEDFRKLYNMEYTRGACQSFCQITTVIQNCSCFDDYWEEFAFNKDKTLKPCRSAKEEKCMLRIEKLYYDGKLTCTCHNPCSEVSYTKAISSRQWPTNEYAVIMYNTMYASSKIMTNKKFSLRWLLSNMFTGKEFSSLLMPGTFTERVLLEWVCDRDKTTCKTLRDDLQDLWTVNNNFLKLNIYYEDLNFENITEKEDIEIQQFLSDVGGAIGLWIGLSMLSICELIQLIVELCYYGFHKSANRKPHRKHRREHNGQEEGRPPHISRDTPHKDYERSGYFSDDERYSHRRYSDSRRHYEIPRDHFEDKRFDRSKFTY